MKDRFFIQVLLHLNCIPAWLIYRNMKDRGCVDADLAGFACGGTFFRAMGTNHCFRSVFYARSMKQYPIATRISKLFCRQKKDLQIEVQDGIGGGFLVYHGDASIIFAQKIGEQFTVYQQVTIGRGKCINGSDIPTIGDRVTVYAGAIIVGGVTIGDDAKIGAGAVVVKDVPPGATVVGAPVRMILNGKEL